MVAGSGPGPAPAFDGADSRRVRNALQMLLPDDLGPGRGRGPFAIARADYGAVVRGGGAAAGTGAAAGDWCTAAIALPRRMAYTLVNSAPKNRVIAE